MTEVTFENLFEVEGLIERAVDFLEDKVVPIVTVKCRICGVGADITKLDGFARGAVPLPDPFPERARVVERLTGKHGKVVENKIVCLADVHKHRRLITIQPDDGSGRDFCQIEEGYDGCSERFILESGWKEGAQGD